MNQKNVVAILGSPHQSGTTAKMLEYAICKAEQAGYSVSRVNLYKMNIAYCTGCEICKTKTGRCVIKDDIQGITDMIKDCDIVILAAPVYWANVPAPTKNLFDRLSGVAMEETAAFPKPRLKGKKYILLTSCNTPAPFSWIFGQSRGAIRNMDEFFKTAGMKPLGKIVVSNVAKRHELPKSALKKIERCFG